MMDDFDEMDDENEMPSCFGEWTPSEMCEFMCPFSDECYELSKTTMEG